MGEAEPSCQNCGSLISRSDLYCKKCGAKLSELWKAPPRAPSPETDKPVEEVYVRQ